MTTTAMMMTDPVLERAVGRVTLVSQVAARGGSGLQRLRQQGSLKAVFPRRPSGRLEAVLVNTAGGVTGGDRFDVSVDAAAGTQICVTTQAAERIYRAPQGAPGRIANRLRVAEGATLAWVPQETILFDGCRLDRSLTVDLEHGARCLVLEPVVFGRLGSGERLTDCLLRDHVTIRRDGRPIYLDRAQLTGDVASRLARPAVGAGAQAMASLVYVADDAPAMLSPLRDMLPDSGGASLLNETTLVMRLLAADGFALRQHLLPVLTRLTHDDLPKNWRL